MEEQPEHAPVGILFVHGIGEQRRGETLSAFGAPVFRWFERWFGSARARLSESVLTGDPEDAAAPAHTSMTIDGERKLLFAESCWADAFPPPSFREVARWAFMVLPWTTTTQFAVKLRALLDRQAGYLLSYPGILVEALIYLGALFLSVLAQVVVVILLGLSVIPIPAFREFLLSLQLKVAGIAGDSYVLLENPIKADAIVHRVMRDVKWLEKKGCTKIGIVAHSQGGAIVHRMLAMPASENTKPLGRVRLFFSIGSGLGKLNDLRGPVEGKWQTPVGWLTMLAILWLTVTLPGLIHGAIADPEFSNTVNPISGIGFFLVAVAALLSVALLAEWCLRGRVKLVRDLRHRTQSDWKPEGLIWVDRYASRDPVPGGALLSHDAKERLDSAPVHNRHSIWTDHTSYWRSLDGLVTEVALRVAELAELSVPHADALEDAGLRRRWRVRWLGVLRMLVLGSALFTVWTLDRVDLLEPAADRLKVLLAPDKPEAQQLSALVANLAGTPTTAGLLIFGLVSLWYFVVSEVWLAWDRREISRLFAHKPMQLGVGWVLTLIALSLAPAGAATAVWWTGGLSQLVALIPVLPEVSRPVQSAIGASLFFGVIGGGISGLLTWAEDWNKSDRLWRHPVTLSVAGALVMFAVWMAILLPVARLYPDSLTGEGTGSWRLDLLFGLGGSALVGGILFGHGWLMKVVAERYAPKVGGGQDRASRIATAILDLPDEEQSELALGIVAMILAAATVGLSAAVYFQWYEDAATVLLVPVVAFALMAGWRARQAGDPSLPRLLAEISLWLVLGALGIREIINSFV